MSLVSAIEQQIISSMNPDRQITSQAMHGFVAQQKTTIVETKSNTHKLLSDQLAKAIDDSAPVEVIDGYKQLISQNLAL